MTLNLFRYLLMQIKWTGTKDCYDDIYVLTPSSVNTYIPLIRMEELIDTH